MFSGSVKYYEDEVWKVLPVKEVVGQSILSYMAQTDRRMVAAILEDGVPKLFIATHEEDRLLYAPKGPTFSPQDLLGRTPTPAYVAGVFPDGSFKKVERKENA